ncbi:hypothetical protein POTOM_005251 [Populus tomentosa]|uniref:Uncharacterized protein n=1 Tax=Populus tomentosa TaxID=118781 RepID=A0A8X8ALS4_POPTO|nr:hypothetical protein POTOM_005251 [Populus tomentosa]
MFQASHPDIVSDFIFHEISTPDADLYTFTGIPASMVEFPALNNICAPLSFLFFFMGVSSATAGTDSVPTTVFATGIDDAVLANAFKIDMDTIQKIKAALASKA